MRWWIIPLLALSIAACGERREQTIARCQLEAFKIWPEKINGNENVFDYVVTCMTAAGYSHKFSKSCARMLGSSIGYLSDECYETQTEYFWRNDILGKADG
jgi:hypothetical protein